MKTYSVILNWQDGDREQGTFGTTVRAEDHDAAEVSARASMRESYIGQYSREGDDSELSDDEIASSHERDGVFGGSVIEISEGAIWRANELETALRALMVEVDEVATRTGWADHGAREAARALLASIDKGE